MTHLKHLFFLSNPGVPADEELRAPEQSVREHGVLRQVCASLPGAEPHEGRGQSVPAALRRREPVRLQGDAARGRSVAGSLPPSNLNTECCFTEAPHLQLPSRDLPLHLEATPRLPLQPDLLPERAAGGAAELLLRVQA